MTDAEIIDRLLLREGSKYVVEVKTCSRWGVTPAALSEYRGRPCTCEDVKRLGRDEAFTLYEQLYLVKPGFVAIPDVRLREFLFDFGVNSGRTRAVKALQRALGVRADGVLGAKTALALRTANLTDVYYALVRHRLVLLGRFITMDPRQAEYAHGWMVRMAQFIP